MIIFLLVILPILYISSIIFNFKNNIKNNIKSIFNFYNYCKFLFFNLFPKYKAYDKYRVDNNYDLSTNCFQNDNTNSVLTRNLCHSRCNKDDTCQGYSLEMKDGNPTGKCCLKFEGDLVQDNKFNSYIKKTSSIKPLNINNVKLENTYQQIDKKELDGQFIKTVDLPLDLINDISNSIKYCSYKSDKYFDSNISILDNLNHQCILKYPLKQFTETVNLNPDNNKVSLISDKSLKNNYSSFLNKDLDGYLVNKYTIDPSCNNDTIADICSDICTSDKNCDFYVTNNNSSGNIVDSSYNCWTKKQPIELITKSSKNAYLKKPLNPKDYPSTYLPLKDEYKTNNNFPNIYIPNNKKNIREISIPDEYMYDLKNSQLFCQQKCDRTPDADYGMIKNNMCLLNIQNDFGIDDKTASVYISDKKKDSFVNRENISLKGDLINSIPITSTNPNNDYMVKSCTNICYNNSDTNYFTITKDVENNNYKCDLRSKIYNEVDDNNSNSFRIKFTDATYNP